MSISNWTPETQTPSTINQAILQIMIKIGQEENPPLKQLSVADIDSNAYLMKKDHAFWKNNTQSLESQQLISLIRFFTLAEDTYNDWQSGEQSPVIFLNKILKSKGERLDKATLLWIKAHSSNQFLPNGPIKL